MTKEDLYKIIQSRGSKLEKSELMDWIASENFEKDLDQFIREDLNTELHKEHETDEIELDLLADSILRKARHLMSSKTTPSYSSKTIEPYKSEWKKQSWISNFSKVAATIVLIASFVFVANYFTKDQPTTNQVVETVVKENKRGRKSTIFLKDGSIVYLNSESKIQFPEVFSDSIRTVDLEGEAYFDIARDESKPFIVQTGAIRLKVLGTSFNINAYEDCDFTKVSLNSGTVEIENIFDGPGEREKVKLDAGQSVKYISKHKHFTEISPFDHDLDLGWKDGKLVFKNADANTVIGKLESWYGVDITLQNKPYFTWGYTGHFENQTLHDVLESLSFSQSFDFDMDNNQVSLKFKPN